MWPRSVGWVEGLVQGEQQRRWWVFGRSELWHLTQPWPYRRRLRSGTSRLLSGKSRNTWTCASEILRVEPPSSSRFRAMTSMEKNPSKSTAAHPTGLSMILSHFAFKLHNLVQVQVLGLYCQWSVDKLKSWPTKFQVVKLCGVSSMSLCAFLRLTLSGCGPIAALMTPGFSSTRPCSVQIFNTRYSPNLERKQHNWAAVTGAGAANWHVGWSVPHYHLVIRKADDYSTFCSCYWHRETFILLCRIVPINSSPIPILQAEFESALPWRMEKFFELNGLVVVREIIFPFVYIKSRTDPEILITAVFKASVTGTSWISAWYRSAGNCHRSQRRSLFSRRESKRRNGLGNDLRLRVCPVNEHFVFYQDQQHHNGLMTRWRQVCLSAPIGLSANREREHPSQIEW